MIQFGLKKNYDQCVVRQCEILSLVFYLIKTEEATNAEQEKTNSNPNEDRRKKSYITSVSITCVSFLSIEQVTYLDGLDKGEQEDPDGDTTSE